MKLSIQCDWCGREMKRTPSHIKRHNFCSRDCLAAYSSKTKNPHGYLGLKDYTNIGSHFTALNLELNPHRMTPGVREKLSQARLDTGRGVSYRRLHGRHEHRCIAEAVLGRKLQKGEVVHHLDGNKRNNNPGNLMVFSSQKEHARYHAKLNKLFFGNGGDAQ